MKFLADENFDGTILKGLLYHYPAADILRVQDVGLMGKDDPTVLKWASEEGRILITHDVNTITYYAYERLMLNEPMPGIIEVPADAPIGKTIEDLILFLSCSLEGEIEGQIIYLPFP
jgi:hypothetical protein